MRVSEKVTIQEINNWKTGDIITIKAGTGVGKSYFIKNNLYAIAKRDNKKILFLIHRSNCKDQFQIELERDSKTDVIEIETYQKLQSDIRCNKPFDINKYQYIVCDEFHYFMSDSWNKFTDLSLNQILDAKDKIRIFMSATGDTMTRYIKNRKKLNTIDYEIPINYDFIKYLEFYHNPHTVHKYIRLAIEKNIKVIFFFKSAKRAFELYQMYKEYSLFNCSKSNTDYSEYVDKEKIQNMLENERFEELFLFTTTAMDAGVNIIDEKLNHIVCDIGMDIGTLVQCIGRKRLQNKTDYINVFIRSISNNELGGFERKFTKAMERADYFKKNGTEKYIEKYYREDDQEQIVYDEISNWGSIKKINELRYFKLMGDIATVQIMKKYTDKYSYCNYIADYFGKEFDIAEEKEIKGELEIYLESITGKVMLRVSDRKELIEKIKVKQNGKLLKSLDTLNSALRERNIDYYIKQFNTSRIVKGKKKNYKTAWKIMRLMD